MANQDTTKLEIPVARRTLYAAIANDYTSSRTSWAAVVAFYVVKVAGKPDAIDKTQKSVIAAEFRQAFIEVRAPGAVKSADKDKPGKWEEEYKNATRNFTMGTKRAEITAGLREPDAPRAAKQTGQGTTGNGKETAQGASSVNLAPTLVADLLQAQERASLVTSGLATFVGKHGKALKPAQRGQLSDIGEDAEKLANLLASIVGMFDAPTILAAGQHNAARNLHPDAPKDITGESTVIPSTGSELTTQ